VREATATCVKCGRRVCELHVSGEGICEVCQLALCQLCGEYLSVGYCEACGRLVCENCSVERGAARVCRECLARGL